MNDITTIGLVVTAQRDAHSPDLKITDFQIFALTDTQAKDMAAELDCESISTEFMRFDTSDEASMQWLLRYSRDNARPQDFKKTFDLVMTYADTDISEKILSLKQKKLLDDWLNYNLDNNENPVSTVETSHSFDDCEIETLSCLLDRINDPVLKDKVLEKFKATLRNSE